jgi:hypothetical protein
MRPDATFAVADDAALRLYASQVTELMESAAADIDAIFTSVSSDPRLSLPDISERADALSEAFDQAAGEVNAVANRLIGLNEPPPVTTAHEEMIGILQQVRDDFEDVIAALESVDSIDDLEAISEDVNEIVAELTESGTKNCNDIQDVLHDHQVSYDLECD